MSINSSAINSHAINGSALTSGGSGDVNLLFTQAVIEAGDVNLLFEQSVIHHTGDAALVFDQSVIFGQSDIDLLLIQKVGQNGNAVVIFDQSVSNPVGNINLVFDQSIADTGETNLIFNQNIVTQASISDSWNGWDVQLMVDGVDKSADLIAKMTIDAEIASARTADFSLLLSGVVNPSEWTGRAVEINYLQNNSAVWRRFSGIIERPEYDVSTKTLRCTCTDQLQYVVNGYSNQQLKNLISGYWDKNVFNADNIGWDYANDLLKTVNKSLHLDSNRQLIVSDLQNKISPDYVFNDDLILDNSLSVQLTQRNQLINRVDITFQSRYQRLFHKDNRFLWTHPRDICDEISNPVTFPTKNMVKQAVEDGNRYLANAAYTGLWPTGLYSCGNGQSIFTNANANGISGFDIKSSFRWQQTVSEEIKVSVLSPLSIALDGSELVEKLSASSQFETTHPEWGTNEDIYQQEAGMVADGLGHSRKNDVDESEVDSAIETLIAQAITTIQQSHAKNVVLFDLPLSPYIELGQTLKTDDADVTSKGVVKRFVETYDFNAGTAITNVEVSISTGGSGLDRSEQSIGAPTRPDLPQGNAVENIEFVQTHIGGLSGSPIETDSMQGVILNVDSKSTPAYQSGLKIPFAAIDDSVRLNITENTDYQINIAIADNLLTINA